MPFKVSFTEALKEVKNRFDILSIISRNLTVKKNGINFVALCPFHDDKSPSLIISPQKGIYKCFSCGATGDMFKFITEYQKITFYESVKNLAGEMGYEIIKSENTAAQDPKILAEKDLLFRINTIAKDFFANNLCSVFPEAKFALNYLITNRSLNQETIDQFELGVSLNSSNALLSHLQKNYSAELGDAIKQPEFLYKTGLFREDKQTGIPCDRFRERLMIPIKDQENRVIAFGARILKDISGQPKYYNSPETAIYQKGQHLFALNIAQEYTKTEKKILLLEGYFDVIQAHQKGIKYAVACLGTALTKEQIQILYQSNLQRKIILGFDADSAGQKALKSSLHIFQELQFAQKPDLKALYLPNVKDIDEFLLKYEVSELESILQNAPTAYEFALKKIFQNYIDLQDNQERRQALEEAVDLIYDIQDPIEQEFVTEYCAESLNFEKNTILNLINKRKPKNLYKKSSLSRPFAPKRIGNTSRDDAQKTLIWLLAFTDDKHIFDTIKDIHFDNAEMQALKENILNLNFEKRKSNLSENPSFNLSKIPLESRIEKGENLNNILQQAIDSLNETISPLKFYGRSWASQIKEKYKENSTITQNSEEIN